MVKIDLGGRTSLVLLKEEAKHFIGKKVLDAKVINWKITTYL